MSVTNDVFRVAWTNAGCSSFAADLRAARLGSASECSPPGSGCPRFIEPEGEGRAARSRAQRVQGTARSAVSVHTVM